MQEQIDDHEARLRRLEQRHTEEMKAINVNVGSKDVLDQLEKISADVDELKIDAKAYTGDAAIFKNKVERVESDVSTIKSDVGTLKTDMEQVKTRLDGHAKYFEEHGKRLAATATKDDLGQLRSEMATKNDITRLEGLIMQLIQQKSGE
jgi:outer membrane murein-binding lipoprotein Lpp